VHGGPRQHIGAPGQVHGQARHPMTNFRRPRSAPPATGRSGTGRKAGMALRSSRAAPSRWKPAAAYPAIPTIRIVAISKRRSATHLSDVSVCRTAIPRRAR
jgi:hypothetical protein